jgi:pimeloyl-ACP methyl ester carboxylesterase
MPPGSLHVTGSDDLELHLLEWSNSGVPMLLLHGFGNEAHIWDDFSPRVAEHYRVLALDLRGHGESAWDPEGRYDYENHLADLDALTTALGIERMVLVGHSLGGRISMLYAGRNPEKLAGLVIVDSAPELDARGIVRIRAEVGEQRDPSFASVAEYENLLAHNYPAATPEALRRMARHGLKQREDGRYVLRMDMAYRVAAGARAATVDDDVLARREESNQHAMWAALEALSSPTLVVRGAASDILSADVADKMVDEVLADGRLAVVPQAGHSVMTDNPTGFAEVVSEFVLG